MTGGKETWLEQRRREKREDAAENERLADAMDRDAEAGLIKTMAAHGLGAADRSAALAEQRRVRDLLNRDRAEAARESARAEAEKAIEGGSFVNIADAVLEPTPEWMAKGDVQNFTPRSPDGTARSVSTVRRVQTPIIVRMHRAGKLSDDHVLACVWYRNAFEFADLAGHSASSQWNPNSTIRRGATDAGFGYVPASEAVAEARDAYRGARDSISTAARRGFPAARRCPAAATLRFFEAVVLDDLPLRQAARLARRRDERAQMWFGQIAQSLFDHLASTKASLPEIDGEEIA